MGRWLTCSRCGTAGPSVELREGGCKLCGAVRFDRAELEDWIAARSNAA